MDKHERASTLRLGLFLGAAAPTLWALAAQMMGNTAVAPMAWVGESVMLVSAATQVCIRRRINHRPGERSRGDVPPERGPNG